MCLDIEELEYLRFKEIDILTLSRINTPNNY